LVAEACDQVNDRYGGFIITLVLLLGMGDVILDRIAFGGVKEIEEVYATPKDRSA
jgi:hypothetical protein